ncbi:hypothetical protein Dtox_3247 [Desulfofarcimen acetoxidans DSM 771]|uniref:DUF7305 domain-containing protein n=1 Tax=Desulfofarcimen acetoxidans (strain ATCC 49208 / DSM 771 / KCTC 5769 / VKM B-1644 / 5575) TaxID=485916 RepID=C8W5I2_DESAS|nr:hypothetical protein [Desulfofarcimen acetoxidans]ACV63982.1 hypothetical protein Dtox_3247 [Desulfofarcimen acetoxidans DSM 771]
MYIKNDKGYVLVSVLMLTIILVILSTSFYYSMSTEGNLGVNYDNNVQAYYYARSGVEVALNWLNPDTFNETTYLYGSLEGLQVASTEPTDNYPIKVSVSKTGTSQIEINSNGTYQGLTKNVDLIIGLSGTQNIVIPTFDMALFAALGQGSMDEPAIKLTGSSKIYGLTGTNAIGESSVQFDYEDTGIIDGKLYIGSGGVVDNVISTKTKTENSNSPNPDPNLKPWDQVEAPWENVPDGIEALPQNKSFPEPQFPPFPIDLSTSIFRTITDSKGLCEEGIGVIPQLGGDHAVTINLGADGYYQDTISISDGTSLTIDLGGGGTKVLRVRNLSIQQGFVSLINTGVDGKLVLYVENSFSLLHGSTINNGGDISRVMMYYKGAAEPSFGGDVRYVGSFFAETANITISGSSGIIGHLITGGSSVIVSGDASAYTRVLYAPHAHLYVDGSGKVKGSIIVNRLSGIGNALIYYEQPNMGTFPVEIFQGGDSGGGTSGGGTSGGGTSGGGTSITSYRWQ